MPESPKKCIGKKVMFTPTNIILNWDFISSGFIVIPVIRGYQLTNDPSKANTAPILST
jgi:hypothetical protein